MLEREMQRFRPTSFFTFCGFVWLGSVEGEASASSCTSFPVDACLSRRATFLYLEGSLQEGRSKESGSIV
jgi:hypothetical protein